MKKLSIIFLATSIPFGFTMFVFYGKWMTSILQGVSFGLFMAVILGGVNYVSIKLIDKNATNSVKQKCELEIPMDYASAFKLCKAAA